MVTEDEFGLTIRRAIGAELAVTYLLEMLRMSTKQLFCSKIVRLAAFAGLAGVTPLSFADEPVENAGIASAGPGVGEIDNAFGQSLQKEPAEKGDDADPAKEDDQRVHLRVGIDWSTAYYSRGFRQEDRGSVVQPWAELGFTLHTWDTGEVGVFLGTWNSLHSKKTGAGDLVTGYRRNWYEADVYAGVSATLGDFTATATYLSWSSPNDAFDSATELQLRMSYDDSEYMGAWALSPSMLFVVEVDGATMDGVSPRGVYFEPSISPGFTIEKSAIGDIEVVFPITAGFSLGNYYSNDEGDDTFLGYETVGVKASVPLPFNEKYGTWTLSSGVTMLFMNGPCKTMNDDDATEVIFTVGLSFEF